MLLSMYCDCTSCTQPKNFCNFYTLDSLMDFTNQKDDGDEIPIEETIETAGFCLLLPGATLDLSSLLAAKKFRYKHGKKGALLAMKMLQRENLGELIGKKAQRGTSSVSNRIYCHSPAVH